MAKLFLLFSHKLTEEQIDEVEKFLEIKRIIYLPNEFQKMWSSISPNGELDPVKLKKIIDWIDKNSEKNDYILVQGEYGSTFYLVDFCFKNGLIPIYSTSKRVYKESKKFNGIIKREHKFKHVNFRKYRKYEDIKRK